MCLDAHGRTICTYIPLVFQKGVTKKNADEKGKREKTRQAKTVTKEKGKKEKIMQKEKEKERKKERKALLLKNTRGVPLPYS